MVTALNGSTNLICRLAFNFGLSRFFKSVLDCRYLNNFGCADENAQTLRSPFDRGVGGALHTSPGVLKRAAFPKARIRFRPTMVRATLHSPRAPKHFSQEGPRSKRACPKKTNLAGFSSYIFLNSAQKDKPDRNRLKNGTIRMSLIQIADPTYIYIYI